VLHALPTSPSLTWSF